MERTAPRPLPSGRLTPLEALVFGLLLTIGAEVYLFLAVNTVTAVLGDLWSLWYVLIYTPLKKITTASTAIGAIPGALPPLWGGRPLQMRSHLAAGFCLRFCFCGSFLISLRSPGCIKNNIGRQGIVMLPVIEEDGRITALQIMAFAAMLLPVSIAPFFPRNFRIAFFDRCFDFRAPGFCL